MTKIAKDVVIIGGGVIGLAIARTLATEKARLLVIDDPAHAAPASPAAAGMLAPSFERLSHEALFRVAMESLRVWETYAAELEEETGQSVDYRRGGALGVARTASDLDKLAGECAQLTARGSRAEMVSRAEARALEPALAEGIAGALFAPDEAQVDARKLLSALRCSVQKKVGPVLAARLVSAQIKNGRHQLLLSSGEAVEAHTVILAAGAGANKIEGLQAPLIFPVKGEAFAVRQPFEQLQRVVRGAGAYLCPKAQGRVIIGATETPGDDNAAVDSAAIARLRDAAAALIPAARQWPEMARWAGLRPATRDGAPVLGLSAKGPETLLYALGHYRNGVLLAPLSAAALADHVCGRPVTHWQPFSPDRFKAREKGTPADNRRHG